MKLPSSLMHRFGGLGLQKRIMLYVTIGLSVMFGVLVFLGLDAIEQGTELVFKERLATAHTTASIMARDFERVAADAREEAELRLLSSSSPPAAGAAQELLGHFAESGPSPFFRVSGVWLLDADGPLLDVAGSPAAAPPTNQIPVAVDALGRLQPGRFEVLRALGPVPGAVPFAAVAVHLAGSPGPANPFVIIHTVSINSSASYTPGLYWDSPSNGQGPPAAESTSEEYHLEAVDPDGVAVLGVGEDERPGEVSRHSRAIAALVGAHRAAALLHEPGPGESFEPHIMAVVPLGSTPFYVVLEQPVDVALAIPLQLRERLVFWIGLGFVATLLVAWVTTRRVVKPTEQLTAAAERMGQGDLVSPIRVIAQDEVGKLAESLDLMRRRLKEAYDAAERTNRELEGRVAERTARLGDLLRQTISAQEEERHRLARELHDETAQTLAALSITLDQARDSLGDLSAPAWEHIRAAKEIATRLLDETRRLILGLRPAVLDDLGLVPAVRWHCETALGDSGVAATIDEDLGAARLPSHVEVSLFRIVQEAVSNIARHADATHVQIRLTRSTGLVRLVVADDGKGFDVDQALGAAGRVSSIGLLGMQERVALLNGSMKIRSAEGAGTTLLVDVPLAEEP